MAVRDQILTAAARVYAEHGFRGATTRRIADTAGVNEVTLFRTFGSKESLIAEALRHHATMDLCALRALPAEPVDPARELLAWATQELAEMREFQPFIRRTMAEVEERPELAPVLTAGWAASDQAMHAYFQRLVDARFTAPDVTREEVFAAGCMLGASLFTDAMGRNVAPLLFPQPAEAAPALYVRTFLRAVAPALAAALPVPHTTAPLSAP